MSEKRKIRELLQIVHAVGDAFHRSEVDGALLIVSGPRY